MSDEKVLTEKQNAFLEALLLKETRGSIRKAMDLAGYAKTTSINSMVESLGPEIHERANKILQLNAPKAAWGMVEVLDDPSAMGARNSIAAAAQIMDRTGLIKKDQLEVKNTGGVMFILPPKNDD
jgi:hypothetical protein|tara:strand:+ start:58 stop:432 length:375 start_codon:yes stop_codon:yes gene_type:complete